MERLTERSGPTNDAYAKVCVLYGCNDCYLTTADPKICARCTALVDRLAAYEDAAPLEQVQAWAEQHRPEPLTLEELQGMGGEPVWIVEHPDWGHWELSEEAHDYIDDRDLDFYGMKYDDPAGKYGLHALGWLAYRTREAAESALAKENSHVD